jgi:hypothetical protein
MFDTLYAYILFFTCTIQKSIFFTLWMELKLLLSHRCINSDNNIVILSFLHNTTSDNNSRVAVEYLKNIKNEIIITHHVNTLRRDRIGQKERSLLFSP